MRFGLTGRMAVAGGLLVLVITLTFAVLLFAIQGMRESADLARRSRVELNAVGGLEKLLVDMETGLRGFVITREERFLDPWRLGRQSFPGATAGLASTSDDSGQAARLRRIAAGVRSYIEDYGVALIRAVRRGDPSASSVELTEQGKRRVDALRAQFDELIAAERALITRRQDAADADARRAAVVATLGIALSVLLILAFIVYLARTIVRPVTRTAAMAGRLSAGDRRTRMPTSGVGEIGHLERSFNTMADSLEGSEATQRRLLEQQSALRRVATLVAAGGPPAGVFAAVAREVGEALPADITYLGRYESDETLYRLAVWLREGEVDEGTERVSVRGYELLERVLVSGKAGRKEGFAGVPPELAEQMRRFHSGVGSPIFVGGRVWGILGAAVSGDATLPEDAETWLTDFTELAGTAISNAEARSELAASRARVVTASDETRRQIERNLHDGAQQRLVSLGLELSAAASSLPAQRAPLRQKIAQIAAELDGVVDDLREISRGIHPAILSEGGLAPALRTLARRSAVPVELDVQTEGRFAEPVEVAAYYVVSEALTNTAKHAEAERAHVSLETRGGKLRVSVRDDGAGGADSRRGSGLVGLRDRVEALGGRLVVTSSAGEGTSLLAELPLATPRS